MAITIIIIITITTKIIIINSVIKITITTEMKMERINKKISDQDHGKERKIINLAKILRVKNQMKILKQEILRKSSVLENLISREIRGIKYNFSEF